VCIQLFNHACIAKDQFAVHSPKGFLYSKKIVRKKFAPPGPTSAKRLR
jgi:hypothetical protein